MPQKSDYDPIWGRENLDVCSNTEEGQGAKSYRRKGFSPIRSFHSVQILHIMSCGSSKTYRGKLKDFIWKAVRKPIYMAKDKCSNMQTEGCRLG